MIKLTPEQIENSKAWIHDILVWGKMTSPQRAIKPSDYYYMYGGYSSTYGQQAAQIICNFILYRKADYKTFEEVDNALDTLSNYRFNPKLSDTSGAGIKKSKEMLAKYLANFMRKNQFFINTSNASTYEIDEIKKTMSGAALWENYCFTCQDEAELAAKQKSNSIPGQPKNGYKAAGPQSGSLPNLIGQPNQKIMMTGLVYCIEADKIGKNTPNAFITPISIKPGVETLPKEEAEKVKFGSGNGYTDCKCWFDNTTLAAEFADKCKAQFGNKFQNIQVRKANADRNGYFRVSTSFGISAYIKASRLNEEILDKYLDNKDQQKDNKDNKEMTQDEINKAIQDEIKELGSQIDESYNSYF